MLVHPLLRRFVVLSGGHCTFPTGGPAICLKNKKIDEAQVTYQTLLRSVLVNVTDTFSFVFAVMPFARTFAGKCSSTSEVCVRVPWCCPGVGVL